MELLLLHAKEMTQLLEVFNDGVSISVSSWNVETHTHLLTCDIITDYSSISLGSA